jgi:hypothetical protein
LPRGTADGKTKNQNLGSPMKNPGYGPDVMQLENILNLTNCSKSKLWQVIAVIFDIRLHVTLSLPVRLK